MKNKILFFVCLMSIFSFASASSEDDSSRKNCLIINWRPFKDYTETLREIRGMNFFMIADSSLSQDEAESLKPSLRELKLIENFFSGSLENAVLDLNSRHKLDSIVAFDEFDILRAARLRQHLNIHIGQSYESAIAFRDKFVMKTILRERSVLKLPKFSKIDSALDLIEFSEIGFPFVLKPRKGAGAERTYVISNSVDLEEIIRNRNLFGHYHNSNLIAEEFIDGEMFNVNGFVVDGKVAFAWPNKYINTCLDMVHGKALVNYTLPRSSELYERLLSFAELVLFSLPTPKNTSFHLELFLDKNGEFVFCEVASRLCGGMLEADWFSAFGFDIFDKDLLFQSGATDVWDESLKKEPSMISGHIEFPSKKGVLLSIPDEVPFDWVTQYNKKLKPGAIVADVTSILDRSAQFSLIAPSEDEFLKRIDMLKNWYNENTLWQD